jgi:hypothetical protein
VRVPLPGIHPSAKPKNHNKAEHFAKDQDRSSDRDAYADLTSFRAACAVLPCINSSSARVTGSCFQPLIIVG